MIKRFLFLYMILIAGTAFSQEQILQAYQQNFIRASLAAKPGILRDAATDYRSGEFIGALYQFALQFALDNSALLSGDPDMITLTAEAARGAGVSRNRASIQTLWDVFLVYRDPYSRVEVLGALQLLGRDDRTIYNLNEFIINQNNLFRTGVTPDYTTLSTCISVLTAFGDAASFHALFSGFAAGYPERISNEFRRALESLQGNFNQYIMDIVQRDQPYEKLAAFTLGTESEKLKITNQGEFAAIALESALYYLPLQDESTIEVDLLKYNAIRIITQLKWIRASHLVVLHFQKLQADYQRGAVSKEHFLEAITCLSVMGNNESAQILALQLGYFNTRAEYYNEYDTDIMLGLIDALGEIGDKAAYDYLTYVSYLNYPEQIKAAARAALTRLRW